MIVNQIKHLLNNYRGIYECESEYEKYVKINMLNCEMINNIKTSVEIMRFFSALPINE